MDDWYSVLQVAPGADADVVATAHRWLSERYSPANDSSEFAAERLRQVNEAFAVLGDPERRAEYDASRGIGQPAATPEPAPAAALAPETPRPASAPSFDAPAPAAAPSSHTAPAASSNRVATVMLGVIVAVTFVVAFAIAIAAWVTTDTGTDYNPNRGDGDYDLENMTLKETDMPEGTVFVGSGEIDEIQQWAAAFFPGEDPGEIDEQEFDAKVAQLEAQGWVRSSVAEGVRPAFVLLGTKSISTLYQNEQQAQESAERFACGLPIALSEQLEDFQVPTIAEQSVGFFHRREFTDESGNVLFSFVDTTVCFRTGRIIHVVQDTTIEGDQDVQASVRTALILLRNVENAYNGTVPPPEDEEEDGG